MHGSASAQESETRTTCGPTRHDLPRRARFHCGRTSTPFLYRLHGSCRRRSGACLEFGNGATDIISGVFRELRLWQNVIGYGLDEGKDGFWGGFLKPVLERVATGDTC